MRLQNNSYLFVYDMSIIRELTQCRHTMTDAQIIAIAVIKSRQAEVCNPWFQMCSVSNERHASFTVAAMTVSKGMDWTVRRYHIHQMGHYDAR